MFKSLYRFFSEKSTKKSTIVVLDYDLIIDERKEIFQNYDLILCEKCNHKTVGHPYYYCESCYRKEIGVERDRMEYGKCKECFQVMTYYHCLSCTRKHFQQ